MDKIEVMEKLFIIWNGKKVQFIPKKLCHPETEYDDRPFDDLPCEIWGELLCGENKKCNTVVKKSDLIKV